VVPVSAQTVHDPWLSQVWTSLTMPGPGGGRQAHMRRLVQALSTSRQQLLRPLSSRAGVLHYVAVCVMICRH
jgi:hypothetical protein